MIRNYILDPQDQPIPVGDVLIAARWCRENPDKVIVQQDEVGPWFLSTVFLHGIDHNWRSQGPPVLWETMMFWKGEGPSPLEDELQVRHTSHQDALDFHLRLKAIVEKHFTVKGTLKAALMALVT